MALSYDGRGNTANDTQMTYRKMRPHGQRPALRLGKRPHLVGADLTPMYGVYLEAIQRVTQRPDGGFDLRTLEISFTTDGKTGERLTELKTRSPWTSYR